MIISRGSRVIAVEPDGWCIECQKNSFGTAENAQRVLEWDSRRFGRPMVRYECRYGNGWHLARARKE